MTAPSLTIRQIADQTGVSVATVSRVLNNRPGTSREARRTVLRAINEVGYRLPRLGNTLQVGLVYTVAAQTAAFRGYDADLAAGVYHSIAEHQAQLAITSFADKRPDETFTQFFIRKHLDGVILRLTANSRELALEITREGFPCIVASDRFTDAEISFVDGDSRLGMGRAMDHLAELGHRRVALAVHAMGDDTDHQDRTNAYHEGVQRNRLDDDPALVVATASSIRGGMSVVDQFLAMTQPPTAILFTNPPPTIGAINRALQRGLRLPADLTIIGYDNGQLRHSVVPAFSAVCQDAERIGQAAGRAILQRIGGGNLPPVQIVMPTVFEVNDTSGPPRVAAIAPESSPPNA